MDTCLWGVYATHPKQYKHAFVCIKACTRVVSSGVNHGVEERGGGHAPNPVKWGGGIESSGEGVLKRSSSGVNTVTSYALLTVTVPSKMNM